MRKLLTTAIIITFFLSYFRLPFSFFQQDEILGFGRFIEYGRNIILDAFLVNRIKHFVPLTMAVSYYIYKIFGMNSFVFTSLGLGFHLINGLLIYRVSLHYLKNKVLSLLAVLIFLSSSVAGQLIMWPVISLNSISLTFSLLAWLAIVKKKLRWVPVFFLGAVFSVEYSAGLIFFIPLAIYHTIGKDLKEKIRAILPFSVVATGYCALRFLPIFFNGHAKTSVIGVGGTPFISKVIGHVPRYFGQLFFGQDILLYLSKKMQEILGLTGLGTAYAETSIFPIVSFSLGFILIVLFVVFYRRTYLLPFSFIFFSSLPFLLVPGNIGTSSVIASRYMYFGVAGMALVIAFILKYLIDSKKKGWLTLVIFLIAFLVVRGTYVNFMSGERLYATGKLRVRILNLIKSSYPALPQRAVFYSESNKSYYGLPDKEVILPFQSGFGQTLMMFYSDSDKLPTSFYPGLYLWEITSQGYEEHEGRGFGYFRDLTLLKETVKKYNLPPEAIIAFSWNGFTGEMTEISDRIRRDVSESN